jgi:hypothetical protein
MISDTVLTYLKNNRELSDLYCLSFSKFKEQRTKIAKTTSILLMDVEQSSLDNLILEGWNLYRGEPFKCRIIVCDEQQFPIMMRKLDSWFRLGCVVVPADTSWIIPRRLQVADALTCAWETSAAANYVARCNLKGHYLEFGTFWGKSFFNSYHELRHWLNGRFYAFDSFLGLSSPMEQETTATGGDFLKGAYCANQQSFLAISDILGVPRDRLRVIPGFYNDTLGLTDPYQYELEHESVSVCYIDCDLYEPTKLVLDFVTPLLQSGALIYFDDWRLCRASRQYGERAAALDWLERNKNIELIEFHRDLWQHQWFIFQKNNA